MFARFVQSMIDTCDQGVLVFADWSAESEPGIVQSVADAGVVRRIIAIAKGFIEVTCVSRKVENRRVNPQMAWVQGRDVGWPERGYTAAGVLILDVPGTHRRRRYRSHSRYRFPPARPFIVEEEESSVFLKRTTDRATEDVTDQLWRFIGFAGGNLRLFD